jgi:hypothetical protein
MLVDQTAGNQLVYPQHRLSGRLVSGNIRRCYAVALPNPSDSIFRRSTPIRLV